MTYRERLLAIKNGELPPDVKPYKKSNKVSSKMTAVKQELKKLYTIFLAKRTRCEIKSPECTGAATCVHHVRGRGKNEILDQGTWMASCERCNGYVEQHHLWAAKNGFKQSRHKKPHKGPDDERSVASKD